MKQIWDMTTLDLEENPLWYFPMDGSGGGDEMSVGPVTPEMPLPSACQMVARASFVTADGVKYPGYVYWSTTTRVNELKPFMWMEDVAVTFWNGIVPPDASYLERVRARLRPESWPIRFASENVRGLATMVGSVEGIYFLEDGTTKCVRP